jgi:hypothetical protein
MRMKAGRRDATNLDQVLAFSLCDKWLQLWRGEGVHESCFGDHQQQHLRACEDGQFVGLQPELAVMQRWVYAQ